MIETQGAVVLEPWLDKIADLSIQIEVGPKQSVRFLGIRRFYTGPQLEYRGTELDPKLASLASEDAEALRFLHHPQLRPLEQWLSLRRP